LREVLAMLAHLIILELCVCLTVMLCGRLLEIVRGRSAATSRFWLPKGRGVDRAEGGHYAID
jgi:hypothetical protein